MLSLLCRGDCGGCVGIPLSVEVIVVGVLAKCSIPLVRGDCCFALCLSLYWEVDLCGLVPCLLCRGCDCLREELCTPKLYYPNLSGNSLCGKSCVDDLVKILLWEGEDVAGCSNLETYLSVCDWSTISKLSLIYLALHCFILFIFISYCLVLFVCHTCVEPRELYIAPQLLFRGI